MLTFETCVVIIFICGILAIIFLIIAVIGAINEGAGKSTIFTVIASLLSAIITIVSYFNITIPTPIVLPLDNDTKTYTDELEITINSNKSKFLKTYYTLDDTEPENGEIYVDKIIITDSTTVCARNKFLWKWSDISTNAYIFIEDTSEPTPEPKLVSITNVSEFYSDGIENSKYSITDNIGNSYEGYTFMSAGDFFVELEGSAVYRNDEQYTRFLGRVIISENEKNDKDCGWIKIYGDNTLLFDTGSMGRGITPIDFDIDISAYEEMKIDFKSGDWSNESLQYPQCYLVNTYFEKSNRI